MNRERAIVFIDGNNLYNGLRDYLRILRAALPNNINGRKNKNRNLAVPEALYRNDKRRVDNSIISKISIPYICYFSRLSS